MGSGLFHEAQQQSLWTPFLTTGTGDEMLSTSVNTNIRRFDSIKIMIGDANISSPPFFGGHPEGDMEELGEPLAPRHETFLKVDLNPEVLWKQLFSALSQGNKPRSALVKHSVLML